MAGVFVSHAAADEDFVSELVDTLLLGGCGLRPEEVFYTSGADTGVPSGEDLLSYVRGQAQDADLVVAVISPAFLTRPVCVAELGAAWGVVGKLFPVLVPGMERTDLEGVLVGMKIDFLDRGQVLDELRDRVYDAMGEAERTNTKTWGRYREKWLTVVGDLAEDLPLPRLVSMAEVERLEETLDHTRAALRESEAEGRKLQEVNTRLREAETPEERREALLPDDEHERYLALLSSAVSALHKLPRLVRDAVWFRLAEGEMPWPDHYEDQWSADEAQRLVREGRLAESTSGDGLIPNEDFAVVSRAMEEVRALEGFLDECTPEFSEWFKDEHEMPPEIDKKAVWDVLFP